MSARVRFPLSARARLWPLSGGLAAGLLGGEAWLSARWPLLLSAVAHDAMPDHALQAIAARLGRGLRQAGRV